METNEILHLFGKLYITDLLRYLIAASLAFTFFYVIFRSRFKKWLIQRKYPENRQMLREFAYSMSTILIFTAIGTLLMIAKRAGYTQIYSDITEYGWAWIPISLLISILFHDFYFYWAHRFMHHPKIFRHVHKVHHLSTNPSPWAAYSFHPVEAFIEAAVLPILVFILPMHMFTVYLFLAHMIIRNVLGHLSMEILPAGFTKNKWLNWNNTVTHHNMHHKYFNKNFGLYFTWCDKLFGTEHEQYHKVFEEVKGRKENREDQLVSYNKKIQIGIASSASQFKERHQQP